RCPAGHGAAVAASGIVAAQIYQGGHVDLYVDAPEALSGRVLLRVPRHEGMSLWPAGTRIGIALAADEAIAFKSAWANVARSGQGVRRGRRSTPLLHSD